MAARAAHVARDAVAVAARARRRAAGVDDDLGNEITFHTAAGRLDHSLTLVGLGLYIVAIVHLAALLSRLQDDDRRAARRSLQLQSWQLRQLVPRPASFPPR